MKYDGKTSYLEADRNETKKSRSTLTTFLPVATKRWKTSSTFLLTCNFYLQTVPTCKAAAGVSAGAGGEAPDRSGTAHRHVNGNNCGSGRLSDDGSNGKRDKSCMQLHATCPDPDVQSAKPGGGKTRSARMVRGACINMQPVLTSANA